MSIILHQSSQVGAFTWTGMSPQLPSVVDVSEPLQPKHRTGESAGEPQAFVFWISLQSKPGTCQSSCWLAELDVWSQLQPRPVSRSWFEITCSRISEVQLSHHWPMMATSKETGRLQVNGFLLAWSKRHRLRVRFPVSLQTLTFGNDFAQSLVLRQEDSEIDCCDSCLLGYVRPPMATLIWWQLLLSAIFCRLMSISW